MVKLLLVEDDASLAYIEKTGLEDIIGGYEVTTATNGKELFNSPYPFKLDDLTIPFPLALMATKASGIGELKTWKNDFKEFFSALESVSDKDLQAVARAIELLDNSILPDRREDIELKKLEVESALRS
jgi:hypothetical protein